MTDPREDAGMPERLLAERHPSGELYIGRIYGVPYVRPDLHYAALARAEKAEAERDRLRGAILMVRDGKYPMGGPIQRYRPDGVPSPHDRCVYGTVHAKHDCPACAQGVLNAALDPTLRTMEDIWDALDPRRENRGPALAADQGEA